MSDTTYHRVDEESRNSRSSSYSFWTWFIAALALIALLWAWHHDKWPHSSCCNGDTTPAAAPVAAAPEASEPFGFTAGSKEDFESTGDHAGINWFNNIPGLENWLAKGEDWRIEGNDKHVTLTGTVDSEATKTAEGEAAQAFFGPDVTVDNQLHVVEPLPAIEAAPEPVVEPMAAEPEADKPGNARIYFDVGFHALPADAPDTLAPYAEWAKNHSDSKIVISGFHDPSGNQIMNIELSKNRAKSVYRHLLSVGVSDSQIEMRKPQSAEGDGSYREARRAEITIE